MTETTLLPLYHRPDSYHRPNSCVEVAATTSGYSAAMAALCGCAACWTPATMATLNLFGCGGFAAVKIAGAVLLWGAVGCAGLWAGGLGLSVLVLIGSACVAGCTQTWQEDQAGF